MPKLTNIQTMILIDAASRHDGTAILPWPMGAGRLVDLAESLLLEKLVRERAAEPGMPVWRRTEDGRMISLVITRTGRTFVRSLHVAKVAHEPDSEVLDRHDQRFWDATRLTVVPEPASSQPALSREASSSSAPFMPASSMSGPSMPAVGESAAESEVIAAASETCKISKRQLVITLLSRTEGTTIKALAAATGWLPHTTRAFLTGLRKRGLRIDSQRANKSEPSIYRFLSDQNHAA